MDGLGRAHDHIFVERLWRTVKYEEVYPKAYDTLDQAYVDGVERSRGIGRCHGVGMGGFVGGYHGLEDYFTFYNNQRPHQALSYRTPAQRCMLTS